MPAASQFELRRKLLQLEALYDVGRALNTLRPEDDLLEELMHRAVAVLDATLGFVFSVDEKLNIQTHFTFGIDNAPPEQLLVEPPIKQVMASREPMMVSVSKFLGGAGSDLLIAPMIAGDAILGIIGVGGKEVRGASTKGAFAEEDLRFLESIASIGGAAIDNTRRFHKLDLVRETLEDENRALKQRMLREYSDRLMVGDSPKMQRVIDLVARVADSQASVIIRGESGTGKEMVARLIHGNSPRKDGPFVAINCAALPETLLESELFGIERGVATGVEARPGKFELAKGGTIFLDEIGDIPLTLQAKLLRVLQEREIEKLGGRRRIPVDVRILSATHRNLEEMIEKGEFRQDLYYRLKVVEIVLPPLRERKDDIPKLVRFFLDKYGKREGLKDVRITQEALQKLMRYPFPGNVRELENLVEGALALTTDPVIDPGDLLMPESASGTGERELSGDLPTLADLEGRYIARVLAFTKGNMSKAAKILGVDRKTLYRKRDDLSQLAPSAESWDIH
ncbi:MAG: sigma-54-dependent Fis family transcriptional regulator [Acidobacteria bacterium]|nr:sigma-54-dependent Fis family transcriptional regulator [Acidobacteriota bacterium]MBV9478265.1 sigma-54-dependent Fis family transcriptional regulator [Acidobacteriota bacterium]